MSNSVLSALYGRPRGGLKGLTGRDVASTPEEIRENLEAIARCQSAGPSTSEFVRRWADGQRWYAATFSPMPPSPDGSRRAAFFAMDITASKAVERESERQRVRMDLALDAAAMGIWEYDLRQDRISWDARTRELLGLGDAESADFDTFISTVHPDDAARVVAAAEAAIAGDNDGVYHSEHRILTPDGAARWVHSSAKVVSDAAGEPEVILGAVRDIHAEMAARERQALLMAELNHRVKNSIVTVQAIARQTLRASPEPEAFRRAFEARIELLAQTHDLLNANAWQPTELGALLRQTLTPFLGAVVLEGPGASIAIASERALILAVTVHELATNAVKHGALSTPQGKVRLAWEIAGDRVEICWTESGGPPVRTPERLGFGTRLLQTALGGRDVSTRLDYDPGGVRVRMTLVRSAAVVFEPAPALHDA
jgi:PAS domain S-box-containing protein